MKLRINMVVRIAAVAAIYAVITIFQGNTAYLGIQFRIAEILNLLAFLNPLYGIGVILGCFISNLFSPMLIVDIVFGTLATALSVFLIGKNKNLFIASLYPVIINAIVIGLELYFVYKLPLLLTMLQITIGEFVVVSIMGTILFRFILKNKSLLNILKGN